MGKTRAAYPPEFRRQMVALVRAGRSPEVPALFWERDYPTPTFLARNLDRRFNALNNGNDRQHGLHWLPLAAAAAPALRAFLRDGGVALDHSGSNLGSR
jgi:hypothetical protein